MAKQLTVKQERLSDLLPSLEELAKELMRLEREIYGPEVHAKVLKAREKMNGPDS